LSILLFQRITFFSTEKVPENFVQANPPQLNSNLKFVQLFRRETKLISEVEYYLTNLISAKMFIVNVNARPLSMEESEFQKHMELAKLGTQTSVAGPSSSQGLPTSARVLHEEADITGLLDKVINCMLS
jgi:Rab5 GDP/GTP exchange factor